MQQSFKTVIADTSCFILLDKIREFSILFQLFNQIYTTPTIAHEFGKPLPPWIIITKPVNDNYQQLLELEVDKGEASAIALSLELENALLIIDDWKARKLSEKLGLPYTGTFGVIIRAKKSGIIPSVKPILDKIRQTNFRFDEAVFSQILLEANEV
jgi:predicted nucleic acid-binding protein